MRSGSEVRHGCRVRKPGAQSELQFIPKVISEDEVTTQDLPHQQSWQKSYLGGAHFVHVGIIIMEQV